MILSFNSDEACPTWLRDYCSLQNRRRGDAAYTMFSIQTNTPRGTEYGGGIFEDPRIDAHLGRSLMIVSAGHRSCHHNGGSYSEYSVVSVLFSFFGEQDQTHGLASFGEQTLESMGLRLSSVTRHLGHSPKEQSYPGVSGLYLDCICAGT